MLMARFVDGTINVNTLLGGTDSGTYRRFSSTIVIRMNCASGFYTNWHLEIQRYYKGKWRSAYWGVRGWATYYSPSKRTLPARTLLKGTYRLRCKVWSKDAYGKAWDDIGYNYTDRFYVV
jgi:hypothetical protein